MRAAEGVPDMLGVHHVAIRIAFAADPDCNLLELLQTLPPRA